MPHFKAHCGYYAYWHKTVDVDAPDLDTACQSAIDKADGPGAWKSGDDMTPTRVDAISEGEDSHPWGEGALLVPARFTHEGEPPLVKLVPAPHGGTIDVVRGRALITVAGDTGSFTSESPPRSQPGAKPVVTVRIRPEDGRPDVTVTGGDVLVRFLD